ncbi:MAG: hypothetical protein K2H22_00680 [Muribaculaceae bacterium]|nr:hypothetical protein [Muribaculaceae bacterium]
MSAYNTKAETMDFSYNAYGDPIGWFGYKKAETYDVAIRIADPGLVGKKVVGLKVPVNGSTDNIDGCKGWLSIGLTAETIENVSVFTPDLAVNEGALAEGFLTVSFTEPCRIPEEGVYIGYSYNVIDVNESDYKTVAVTDGKDSGGLWIHSSSTQKTWADMTKRNSLVSAMTVFIEGEFLKDPAVPVFSEELRIAEGEKNSVPLVVANNGSEGIYSIEYAYDISGITKTGMFEFPSPIPPVYGRKGIAAVEIAPVEGLGETSLSLSVVKVNGKPNEATGAGISIPVIVQKFVPVYRPLVEEYTGLNCGYCPRGYVMLEQMKESYGDRFVGVSYHSSGWEGNAMVCIKDALFPVQPSGYPAASINRNQTIDPSNIPVLWEKCYMNQTQAEIKLDWEWTDDSDSRLKAVANVRFLQDIENSDYRIAFIMLADGLSNPKWVQSNYYSDYQPTGEYSGPFWDLFIGKGEHVTGLKFNDIVVHASDYKGVEGSLPSQIVSGEWYGCSYEVDPQDIVNLSGTHIVEDFDMTRMVAVIVDGRNGKPINCISSSYPSCDNGTEMKFEGEQPEAVLYFDMQGRRIGCPAEGIYIKTEIFNDGSLRTSKIIK